MRIVYLSPYNHNGAHSGLRVRTENICKALADLPDTEVICLSPWQPPEGVRHRYVSLDCGWMRRLLLLPVLTIKLQKMRPDLVISEAPLAPISLGRFKSIHVIHDAKFATAHGRRGRHLVSWLHWLSARMADRVMTVSRAERDRIAVALKISSAKIVVSYNGIAPSWLTPLPESQTFAYDLIYVSNFARHKGHQRFLEAIAGTRWRVLFVGADFGERANLVQYAKQMGIYLTIREGLTEEELIAEYDASRIFVFPSELEGFGIPYIEARARGVPVIAQDLSVFRELQELVGGNLIDFDKPDQLKDALSKSLQEPRTRPDLEPFLWPKLARGLLTNLLH